MFNIDQMKKQMEESQKRWNEISELASKIKQAVDANPNTFTDGLGVHTAKLLLLLVEQLKPMGALDSAEFDAGMKQILDAFTGGK